MDDYIFIAGEVGIFNSLVNEKMFEYEPLGAPVVIVQTIKTRTVRMGQAMTKRRIEIKTTGFDFGTYVQESLYKLPDSEEVQNESKN